MFAANSTGKPHSRAKTITALTLLVGWAIATAYGFWWFQVKDLRSFPLDTRNLEPAGIELAADVKQLLSQLRENNPGHEHREQITFVNIWDPDCPCNRFSEAHIRDLVSNYKGRDVHTVTVTANTKTSRTSLKQLANLLYDTPLITADNKQLFSNKLLPYTPFAMVLDGNGDLKYVGPYSSGPGCGRRNGAFVEKTLDALLAGKQPKGLHQNVSGCFCDTQAAKTIS